jgi:uncharacterized protein
MASSGESDLKTLLASMTPSLSHEIYAFCTIPAASTTSSNILSLLMSLPSLQMLFREDEGWTVILPKHVAEEVGMETTFPCKKITLGVHSSLEAVGFLAAVTTRLKEVGVGCNPISGFYHDHLFIPEGREHDVMDALRNMSEGAGSTTMT